MNHRKSLLTYFVKEENRTEGIDKVCIQGFGYQKKFRWIRVKQVTMLQAYYGRDAQLAGKL